MLQLGFGPIDEEHVTAYRQMSKCRLYLDEQSPVFPPESEVLYPSRVTPPRLLAAILRKIDIKMLTVII
jgi:hypothetical protein